MKSKPITPTVRKSSPAARITCRTAHPFVSVSAADRY
jgi:hypothetical protein